MMSGISGIISIKNDSLVLEEEIKKYDKGR